MLLIVINHASSFAFHVYVPYLRTCIYTFTQVIWKHLYKEGAYKDAETLAQLKSLINRTNVPKKPKVNVNAAEDFLKVDTVVSCACKFN